MGKYDAERRPPTVGYCGPMTTFIQLRFDGNFLHMKVYRSPTGTSGNGDRTEKGSVYQAVSGQKKNNGRFDYSKSRQKERGQGPIPEGQYWINPSEMWENGAFKVGSRSSWGNFRITLHPYPGTKHHGRGGFFIHGGDTAGSAGCIDLTDRMDTFVKDLRRVLAGEGNCRIDLTVAY